MKTKNKNRMKLRLLSFLFLFIPVLFNDLNAQWIKHNFSDEKGQITDILTDGDRVFAATLGGGIFISSDYGRSWQEANTGIDWKPEIYSLIKINNIIYAATGSGVYRSTDCGGYWEYASKGFNTFANTLSAFDHNLYGGSYDGVYISTDGGENWTKKVSGITLPFNVLCFTASSGYIYAGGSRNDKGLYVSSDGGNSWNPANNGLPASVAIYSLISNGNEILAAASTGLYKSVDQGSSWQKIYEVSFNVLKYINNNLYAASSDGIYMSTNNGSTWIRPDNKGIPSRLTLRAFSGDDVTFYAGTAGGGIYISGDGGDNWWASNKGLKAVSLCYLSARGNKVFLGTVGSGIYVSENNAQSWTNYFLPVERIQSIDCVDNNIFVGTNNGLFKPDSINSSLVLANTGISSGFTSIFSLAADGSYLWGASVNVYLSSDKGVHWAAQSSGIPPALGVMSIAVNKDLVLAGTLQGIYRSTDHGKYWSASNYGFTSIPYVSRVDIFDKTIIAITSLGIYKSENEGITWTLINIGYPYIDAFTFAGGSIFAAAEGAGVYRSSDQGITWNKINTGLSNVAVCGIAVANNRLFIRASGNTVWSRPLSEILSTWKGTITLASANGLMKRELKFGQSPAATDGLDNIMEEIPLPPLPPSDVMDLRWKIPASTEFTVNDFRSETVESCTWTLNLQAPSAAYPVTLNWDPQSLPNGYVHLKDVINGSLINVDMKTQSSYTLTNPNILSLKIEYLKQGAWITAGIKTFLQGAYNSGSMVSSLAQGNLISLSQPYNSLPWSYAGTESLSSIPSGVVDWVLVELRTGTASSTMVARRAGLLKSDGTIIDLDGVSPLSFTGVSSGNYYIVVRHRNHIPVMSSSAVALSSSSALYDFTLSQSQAYGTNAMKDLGGGVYGMYAGDSNKDGQVTALDFNTWNSNTKTGQTGYVQDDMNMDGQVTVLDFNFWNANTKTGAQSYVP